MYVIEQNFLGFSNRYNYITNFTDKLVYDVKQVSMYNVYMYII